MVFIRLPEHLPGRDNKTLNLSVKTLVISLGLSYIFASFNKYDLTYIISNKGFFMARTCDLTGKRRLVANKVSHANNKTKTKKQVNLHTKKVFDPETNSVIRLRLSAHAIRTLDKVGSISKYVKKNAHLFE